MTGSTYDPVTSPNGMSTITTDSEVNRLCIFPEGLRPSLHAFLTCSEFP